LELDAESTNIVYKDYTNTPDWDQTDLTALIHCFRGYNWDIKLGIHNIFIDQDNNSDHYDKVLIAGLLYYKYLKYNVGVDYYYSTYDGFNVQQITPKMGVNLGNYYSPMGSFYLEGKVNYIHVSDNATNNDNYTNIDLKLQNYKGRWVTEISGSVGKNTYKVANGGFVVYNLSDEYKYSFGGSVKYFVNKTLSLKIGISRSKYTVNNNDAYANTYAISISKFF